MARKVAIVATPKPGQGSTLEIPQDVKDEIEEAFEALRTAEIPSEIMVEFDTEDEKKVYMAQVRSYCRFREAGALKVRQLPSKHLPPTQVRFQITLDLPENGAREGNS